MLTKDDKKFIEELISKNNDVLVKEMIDLFTVTNERIDKVEEKLSNKIDNVNKNLDEKIDKVNEYLGSRIDRVLDQLRDDDESINDHEKRIGKLEEKVFIITTSS